MTETYAHIGLGLSGGKKDAWQLGLFASMVQMIGLLAFCAYAIITLDSVADSRWNLSVGALLLSIVGLLATLYCNYLLVHRSSREYFRGQVATGELRKYLLFLLACIIIPIVFYVVAIAVRKVVMLVS